MLTKLQHETGRNTYNKLTRLAMGRKGYLCAGKKKNKHFVCVCQLCVFGRRTDKRERAQREREGRLGREREEKKRDQHLKKTIKKVIVVAVSNYGACVAFLQTFRDVFPPLVRHWMDITGDGHTVNKIKAKNGAQNCNLKKKIENKKKKIVDRQ